MTEKSRILYYLLWVMHPVLQTAIAVVMVRRKQYRQFKYFFAYIIAQTLTFSIVFLRLYFLSYSTYFYASWFSTAISVALGFQVIHEAFLDVFRPFHTLRDLGTVLFKWAWPGNASGCRRGFGFRPAQRTWRRGCRRSRRLNAG